MATETWKEVSGFPGYDISDFGRVRSRWRFAAGRIKAARVANGYYRLSLYHNSTPTEHYVHRLVLQTFVGPAPSDEHEAAHLDGDRLNNILSNLIWATAKENATHKELHGTTAWGHRLGQTKLSFAQIDEIISLHRILPGKEIAERFGIHVGTVHQIHSKKINYRARRRAA